jgi:hypothetical protein
MAQESIKLTPTDRQSHSVSLSTAKIPLSQLGEFEHFRGCLSISAFGAVGIKLP